MSLEFLNTLVKVMQPVPENYDRSEKRLCSMFRDEILYSIILISFEQLNRGLVANPSE